ncbi:MAG: hypothetical protein ACE5H3_09645, partial [Planctomycetota bacterium]
MKLWNPTLTFLAALAASCGGGPAGGPAGQGMPGSPEPVAAVPPAGEESAHSAEASPAADSPS